MGVLRHGNGIYGIKEHCKTDSIESSKTNSSESGGSAWFAGKSLRTKTHGFETAG